MDSLLTASFVLTADKSPWRRLLYLAILIRLCILVAMSVSCAILPDFRDETLAVFPLRLFDGMKESTTAEPAGTLLFAVPGSFCDCGFSSATRFTNKANQRWAQRIGYPSRWRRQWWSFVLNPLTRWDSARFLRLAHQPTIRNPQIRYAFAARSIKADEETCPNRDAMLHDSEEAHPFLPLFPFMIQLVARTLMWIVPSVLLPPTCESVLVLSAWVLNTLCFVWAACELYIMTKLLLSQHSPAITASTAALSDQWAKRVMLLFMINPATVFFGVAYSEALGSALVFAGCRHYIKYSTASSRSAGPLLGAAVAWWLACWVRSNGSLYAGILFLTGIGCALQPSVPWLFRLYSLVQAAGLGVVLLGSSLIWHNYNGYLNHCTILDDNDESLGSSACPSEAYKPPLWCRHGLFFNLYSYVQRKHWNVGFLRYYEWKQLPNFLLAAPVLIASFAAVSTWITKSWNRFRLQESKAERHTLSIVQWAILSLQHSVAKPVTVDKQETRTIEAESNLLGSPFGLGHFAVLAASALLSLFVAHVQISTRMLFSTCPALYWFLAVKIGNRDGLWGQAILAWCLLYVVLGVVMHPNWLPWT